MVPVFSGFWRLAMLLPLALAVSVVYKTLKLSDLRSLVPQVLLLWVTMVVGMMAAGAALLVIYDVLA